MERKRSGELIKKGPWTAEEDEVLINFVNKNGPRDWSSIRSNGLLPRTGKSCRLRWVNKLRPNLKTGCKFTAEEERLVLELQARIGNKWATIASYLPGRTDNDVKNFWSSRQKRLARILRSPSPVARPLKNKGKSLADDLIPNLEAPKLISTQLKEEHSSSNWDYEMIKMAQSPSLTNQNLFNINTDLPLCEITDAYKQTYVESQFKFSFQQLPMPNPGFPLLPESTGVYGMGPIEPEFSDAFTQNEAFELGNLPQLNVGSTSSLVENESLENPDGFFDDFPIDFLEQIEKIPSSSPQ